MLDILKAINDRLEIKDLFVDAINAMAPILMMAIVVINCLLHNPDGKLQGRPQVVDNDAIGRAYWMSMPTHVQDEQNEDKDIPDSADEDEQPPPTKV